MIVIPARYQSTRYPGKPLALLKGATGESRSLIERTWRAGQGISGVDRVVVATDDERIRKAAEAFGAEVVMTSSECRNGTERCAEVAARHPGYDLIINLQGDAPLTPSWFLDDLIAAMKADPTAEVATPVLNCSGKMRADLIQDRHEGRVGGTTAVFDSKQHALYFSKEVIPFSLQTYGLDQPTPVFHHIGVYAYRPAALSRYIALPETDYERLEGLEQLRFVGHGIPVLCVKTEARGREFWELNNPEDIPKIETMLDVMGLP